MGNEQDMMRKISALLAKAESTDNENEASTFFEKAQELMLKYAIDEARVREALRQENGRRAESPVKQDYMFATHDAHAKGKVALLNAVAKANHCMFLLYGNSAYSNTWRDGNQGKYSQWGVLIGYEQDLENVKVLYTSLLIQWARFVHQDIITHGVWKKQEFGFRTGHLVGFASRLRRRFTDLEERVVAAANASALMVNKDAEIDAFYRAAYGLDNLPQYCLKYNARGNASCSLLEGHEGAHKFTVKTRSSRSRGVNSAGWYAGQEAADRADIGLAKVGSNAQQLKG